MSEKSIDLDDFKGVKSNHHRRTVGGLTIVHSKNGYRLNLSYAKILKHLDDPETVQLAYSDDMLAIGTDLEESLTDYRLSGTTKNKHIYNKQLVKELINHFELDFENRTSRSFKVAKVQEYEDDTTIVFIQMK